MYHNNLHLQWASKWCREGSQAVSQLRASLSLPQDRQQTTIPQVAFNGSATPIRAS